MKSPETPVRVGGAPNQAPPSRRSRGTIRSILVSVALLLLAGCHSLDSAPSLVAPTLEERIAFHRRQAEDHPLHAPARALLGQALLEKARLTLDPETVKESRRALEQSISIQPSLGAYRSLAALEGFAHRFERSLEWAQRAHRTEPGEPELLSILVEAHLGLGQDEAAMGLLDGAPDPGAFHVLAAWGHLHAGQGRYREAAAAFHRATETSLAREMSFLRLWARILEAGAYLDGGFPSEAEPILNEAATIDPDNPLLLLHISELDEAQGEIERALERCRSILSTREDPFVEARTFSLCRRLGREEEARNHLERARSSLQRVIDAGEDYTLEAQARLLAQAGVDVDLALALALRNLEVKRDRAAYEALEMARQAAADED